MNILEMSTISDNALYHVGMSTTMFGDWLKHELDVRDLTQQEFARMIDVSQTTISSWINDVQPPTKRNCRRIADALGIDRELVYSKAGRKPDPETPTGHSTQDPLTGSQGLSEDTVTQFLNRIERSVAEIHQGLRWAGLLPVDIELSDDYVGVPVIGRVPADSVRWAAMEEECDVKMLRADVGSARAPFGLVASGDCLKSIGIFSGDIVICDRPEGREPRDRQLVVVRVGSDVTLKRWCVTPDGVELRDGDEQVVHCVAPGDDIEIVGFYLTYKPIAER